MRYVRYALPRRDPEPLEPAQSQIILGLVPGTGHFPNEYPQTDRYPNAHDHPVGVLAGTEIGDYTVGVGSIGVRGLSAGEFRGAETDTAQALSFTQAGGAGEDISPALETDKALIQTQFRSVLETDSAQVLSVTKTIFKTLTVVTETDIALVQVQFRRAAETDTAQVLSVTKTIFKTLTLASETDSARIQIPFRLAQETDTAQVLAYSQAGAFDILPGAEADSAQALSVTKTIFKSLTEATETDLAKVQTQFRAALEADTAQSLDIGGPARQLGNLVVTVAWTLVPATETDSAQALSVTKTIFKTLTLVSETDSALVQVQFRRAVEADSAQALTYSQEGAFDITPATETDQARIQVQFRSVAETDAAQALQVTIPGALAFTGKLGRTESHLARIKLGALDQTAGGTPTPAGISHAKSLGALRVNPQVRLAGLVNARALGEPRFLVVPAGLVNTRALGSPRLSPTLFVVGGSHARQLGLLRISPGPPGLVHARALGAPLAGRASVRALGSLIVSIVWIPRPEGQVNVRVLGSPGIHGHQLVSVESLENPRSQGDPKLSARTSPIGIVHARALGAPSVNPRTASPAALSNTRAQGSPVTTVLWIARPESLVHARALGTITVRGHMIVGPPSLENIRAQGNPLLTGRATPVGIIHFRILGDTDVNPLDVEVVSLDRVGVG